MPSGLPLLSTRIGTLGRARTLSVPSPRDAQLHGIQTIYQEVHLAPQLSIARNVFLGREHTRFGALDLRRMNREAAALLDLAVPVVTYCWGPGCNGATRAALALAQLGYQVKEMLGGFEYWAREGFAVVWTAPPTRIGCRRNVYHRLRLSLE